MNEEAAVEVVESEPEWRQMLVDGPVLDQLREEIAPDNRATFARFLLAAAHQGRLDVIFQLFEMYKSYFNPHSPLPLMAAAHGGHLDVIRSLVSKRRLNINASLDGITTIGYCVASNNEPAVCLLVELGATAQNARLAARRGYLPIVKALESYAWFQVDTVSAAAEGGQMEVIRYAFERLAAVTGRPNNPRLIIKELDARGAVAMAAANGHLEILTLLLDMVYVEANNNAQAPYRYTIPSLLNANGAVAQAAVNGHLAVVQYLVERMNREGFEVVPKDAKEVVNKALVNAARAGRAEVMRYLLDNGAVLPSKSPLLHEAAARGDVHVLRLLIKPCGMPVNSRDKTMASPIYLAAKNGHYDAVCVLFGAGARLDRKGSGDDREPGAEQGEDMEDDDEEVEIDDDGENGDDDEEDEPASYKRRTPLMVAAQLNHLEIVRYLIAHGADVDAVNELGWSALTYAVHNAEIMRELLNARAMMKGPVLQRAIRKGTSEEVELVLSLGAKINVADSNGKFPLGEAARAGKVATVELLLEKGANVDAVDKKRGRTAFYIAATHGHTDVLRCLLAHGAKIDKHSSKLQAPLYLASKRGHLSTVELLLELGADVNRAEVDGFDAEDCLPTEDDPNLKGWTPLMAAASENHKEVVALLLTRGARVGTKDGSGNSPYDYAARNHLPEIMTLLESFDGAPTNLQRLFVEVVASYNADDAGSPGTLLQLIKRGADVNRGAYESSTDTPLMVATMSERREHASQLMSLLVQHGANANAVNKKGESVLLMAARTCSSDCVELLLNHGARIDLPVLLAASQNHDVPVLKVLLAHGAADFIRPGPDQQPQGRLTPYKAAIQAQNWRAIPLLAAHGADISQRIGGKLGLHLAVDAGRSRLEAVRAMLDAGAPVRGYHIYGFNILHLAYLSVRHYAEGVLDFIELVRLLICHGADLNVTVREEGGQRPGELSSADQYHTSLYHRLGLGDTLLETITKVPGGMDGGLVQLMRVLLEHGADPKLHDSEACKNLIRHSGNTDAIHLLLDYGVLANTNLDALAAQMLEREHVQVFIDRITAAFTDIATYVRQPVVPVCLLREVFHNERRMLHVPPWTRALQSYTPLPFRAAVRAILMLRRTPEGEATWGELPAEVLEYIVACAWVHTSVDLQTVAPTEELLPAGQPGPEDMRIAQGYMDQLRALGVLGGVAGAGAAAAAADEEMADADEDDEADEGDEGGEEEGAGDA